MIKGKTKSGFKYEVDERIKTDWRLVKAIADSQSNDDGIKLKAVSDMFSLVLGGNEELLMQHIANRNDGFVPMEQMNAEITEIIQSISNSKN